MRKPIHALPILALMFTAAASGSFCMPCLFKTESMEAEWSKHIDLGTSGAFKQQVLGGSERLRSHPTGRYRHKAAIYYAAELRLNPERIGFRDWPLIRALPIRCCMRLMIGNQVMRFELAHGEETDQFWFLVGQAF